MRGKIPDPIWACRALANLLLVVFGFGPVTGGAQEARPAPAPQADSAPKWDAPGPGLSPWQSIASIDASDDGARIALSALALPGDPNVFVLDGEGKLLGQFTAGVRAPEQVVLTDGGRAVLALYGTPKGTAGDRPQVVRFSIDGNPAPKMVEEFSRTAGWFFHYGDHSNHLGFFLLSAGEQTAIAGGGQVTWLASSAGDAAKPTRWGGEPGLVTTAAAMNSSGTVVMACAQPVQPKSSDSRKISGNLCVIEAGARNPLWVRPIHTEVDPARALEKGIYGPAAPEYHDEKVYAPLAVAIDAGGQHIAVADYQGWERRFAARGIRREEDYGVRFLPARPAITVYDRAGKTVRRWEPTAFKTPFWCDLAFSDDGSKLQVKPRLWPCRGLAGRGVLPVDEGATTRYVLDIATGDVQSSPTPEPILTRTLRDGRRLVCRQSIVEMLDPAGKSLWMRDLKSLVKSAPLSKNLKAREIAPGIWTSGGGNTHSDLGGQYVIQAPQGLILIDPNAGLSFAQYWARIRGAGLDPMQVRYVLLTHEHGDHAPGAYLWRCLTGAKVVAGAEAAYTLQHHIPTGTGYGFHPPQPIDIAINHDQELDLAGLKVRAVRAPGHTFGSMAWMFEKDGKRWISIGDLIMPGGVLGYSGSINFSAADALASLRKLAELKPDGILPGHGPTGGPAPYLKGIEVGMATGWGKMKPEKPDPFYGFERRDYLIAGWLESIQSAAFGDIDHDGRPDVAILATSATGSALKIFLNKGGRFAEQPDAVIELPQIDKAFKLKICDLNGDGIADFLASSESTAVLLVSQNGKLDYRAYAIQTPRAATIVCGDFNGDGRTDCLLGGRFVNNVQSLLQQPDGSFRPGRSIPTSRSYFDMELVDVNGDGKPDLLLSSGEIFLRRHDGTLPDGPSVQLPKPGAGWTYLAVGDFNGDKRPDVVLISQSPEGEKFARLGVFYNTGDGAKPFGAKPDAVLELPLEKGLLRDGPTVGDWNGDGVADIVIASGQSREAIILTGSAGKGLDVKQKLTIPLDFSLHHDTKLGIGDFTGDGKPDLAAFGTTTAGAPGVYIRRQ